MMGFIYFEPGCAPVRGVRSAICGKARGLKRVMKKCLAGKKAYLSG